jgi:hypothetical protein
VPDGRFHGAADISSFKRAARSIRRSQQCGQFVTGAIDGVDGNAAGGLVVFAVEYSLEPSICACEACGNRIEVGSRHLADLVLLEKQMVRGERIGEELVQRLDLGDTENSIVDGGMDGPEQCALGILEIGEGCQGEAPWRLRMSER